VILVNARLYLTVPLDGRMAWLTLFHIPQGDKRTALLNPANVVIAELLTESMLVYS
jgi:hypothetical protein